MKISRGFSLLMVLACLLFLGVASAWSQTNFSVKIHAEDGSGWKDSVYIGKYTSATSNLIATRDSINPTLNEAELPPVPPAGSEQAADLRLDDPNGGGAYGQGVGVDIRNLVSDGQKDVYRVKFRRSGEGTGITLSWPSGLDAVSGGGFYLTDGLGGFLFAPVAMHEDTSFEVPPPLDGLGGGFVDIVVGDGSMMRTFISDSIALSLDYKGKAGKLLKRKPYRNEFQLTINAPARPEGAEALYLDFSMKIVEGTISFPGNGHLPINFGSLEKKFTFNFAPALDSAQMVVVNAIGDKGKVVKGKYYFYNNATLSEDKKLKVKWGAGGVHPVDYEILRQRMPNVNNVGDELYLQGTNLGVGLTTQVGTTVPKGNPIYRSVSLPKWKDVFKTLYKFKSTVYLHSQGPAQCLDTIKSKENYKKPIKSIDPFKYIRYKTSVEHGNKLLGEMIALKFNIAISEKQKTPAQGFGELIYTNDGHPFNGMTVNDIADSGDAALSCWGGLPGGWTYEDMAAFLLEINSEFSGPFDTLGFASPAPGKTEGTVLTGIKPVVLSDIFTGSGLTFAPVAPTDYSSLYDVPEVFGLSQNYPNPFNPTTTIEFTIPEDAIVSLKVYNMLGQEVATLADREEFTAGENWVELDGKNLATGIYYYRISVNDNQFQDVKKMILMK